jgi:siroheme synthase (precorrin-2 oxidase/ferrochelatase)
MPVTNLPTQKDEVESNQLFPVFLKLEALSVLVIGGGNVALEKLQAVLNNSPATKIKLVSVSIDERIEAIAAQHSGINLVKKEYAPG